MRPPCRTYPREKGRFSGLDDWLKQIHARVGDDARILLVATHAAEDRRGYRYEYGTILEKYGKIVAGSLEIDSATGHGFETLVRWIQTEAVSLKHVGEKISERWVNAREALLEQTEPKVDKNFWDSVCDQRFIPQDQRELVLDRLNAVGRIIYFTDDMYLRNVIVRDPEWLTKAIGYVMADRQCLDAKGELPHERLNEIWLGHRDPRGPTYKADHLPYLLRLMERFDISYEVPHRRDLSLVGELVPEARPADVPWYRGTPLKKEERELALVCRVGDELPGFMARLIVRTHRYTTGRHWTRGVFVLNRQHEAAALFELTNLDYLYLTVRSAQSPVNFFEVLREHVDAIIFDHYKDMPYYYLVPCPEVKGRERCKGFFELNTLERARQRNLLQLRCHACLENQDVLKLLTGFNAPGERVESVLREIQRNVKVVRDAAITTQKGLAALDEKEAGRASYMHDLIKMVTEVHEQALVCAPQT
jgi:internalin A